MGNPVAAYDPGVGLPSFTLFYFNLLIFNLNVFHTSCLSPSRNRKQHREVHRQQTGGDRNYVRYSMNHSPDYAYLHSRNAFLVVLLIITFESNIFYKVKQHESEIVFLIDANLNTMERACPPVRNTSEGTIANFLCHIAN